MLIEIDGMIRRKKQIGKIQLQFIKICPKKTRKCQPMSKFLLKNFNIFNKMERNLQSFASIDPTISMPNHRDPVQNRLSMFVRKENDLMSFSIFKHIIIRRPPALAFAGKINLTQGNEQNRQYIFFLVYRF